MNDPSEDRRTPGPDGEKSSEEDDRVDALAALPGPVGGGIEVQPEGKLVKGKGSSDSVGEGKEPAEEDGP